VKYVNGTHSPFAHETERDVAESLKAEYREMVLYAGRDVIVALHDFIEEPSNEGFAGVLLEMRKDLWEKNMDLQTDELLLASSKQNGI
jgi:3-dehydroquinate dehydratase